MPNFEEIWPSDKNKDDKYKRRLIGMEYYMDVSSYNYEIRRFIKKICIECIECAGNGEPWFEGPPAAA